MRQKALVAIFLCCTWGCSDDGRPVATPDGPPPTDAKAPLPDGKPPLPDAGPLPDTKIGCAPGDPPELAIRLVEQGDTYVANVKSVGCGDAVRLVGCCGEGRPTVERAQPDGTWAVSNCIPPPGACCNAMPGCQLLPPGKIVEIPVALEQCPAGTYRVSVAYGDVCADPEPWTTQTPLQAISNPIAVGK